MLLEKRRGLRARRIVGITACEDDDEEECVGSQYESNAS